MIDRVLEMEDYVYCKAVKNISGNEPFFEGHFPHYPIMPGVLIVEAFAQTAGFCWIYSSNADNESKIYGLLSANKQHFRRPVLPGDQLVLEVRLKQKKFNVITWKCRATVDGKLVADAILMTGIINLK